MRFIILLSLLFVSPCFAQGLQTLLFPGASMPCDGTSHLYVFKPVCPAIQPSAVGCASSNGQGYNGGGNNPLIPGYSPSWPPSKFTIWSTNFSMQTNDPNADGFVGLWGLGGDSLTPDVFGQANIRQVEPAAGGRVFDPSTDEIHFHVTCASGKTMAINAQFEYSVP